MGLFASDTSAPRYGGVEARPMQLYQTTPEGDVSGSTGGYNWGSLQGFNDFYQPSYGGAEAGPSQTPVSVVEAFLAQKGYRPMEEQGQRGRAGGKRYVVDSKGNVVGAPQDYGYTDTMSELMMPIVIAAGQYASGVGAGEAASVGSTSSAGAGGYWEGSSLGGFGGAGGSEFVSNASLDALAQGSVGAAGGAGLASGSEGGYVPTSSDKQALYGTEGYGAQASPAELASGNSYWDSFSQSVPQFFQRAMSTPKGMWGLAQLGSSLYGMYEQRQNRKRFRMPNAADMPGMPGYQAGLEAVRRGMASRGYAGSTNMDAALLKYGGDFYNQFANQQMLRAQQESQFSNAGNLANLAGGFINAWGG